jgi:Xaa-Pro dipeptidase
MDYALRRKTLITSLGEIGIGACLISNLDNIHYLTGYKAVVASRPIGLFLTGGLVTLIVPAVEADCAREEAAGIEISVYYEQPERAAAGASFNANLSRALAFLSKGAALGVEENCLVLADYRFLSGLGYEIRDIGDKLKCMRAGKEPEELRAIRIAAQYVDLTVGRSLTAMRSGISEIEVDQAGTYALIKEVAAAMPEASVGYFVMSQSGPARTVMPHAFSSLRPLQRGDGLIHCRQVSINGYRAQCDRTAFLGQSSPEQAKYLTLVKDAQEAACAMIRPGVRAAVIDAAIRSVFEKSGVACYYIHRSGCGIGISMKEAPYISYDSREIIEADMALLIQPALYIPGIGGFRLSDTVIVGETGCERITNYPQDIQSLTLPE